MNIEKLRQYRMQFESPFFNDQGQGIALFDLIISFLTAYILEKYFSLSNRLPGKNKVETYYLLVVPLGIIVHHLVAHFSQKTLFPTEFTFLNQKIFSLEFNMYKVIFFIILYLIYNNFNPSS